MDRLSWFWQFLGTFFTHRSPRPCQRIPPPIPYKTRSFFTPPNPHCFLYLTLQRTSLESPISLRLDSLFSLRHPQFSSTLWSDARAAWNFRIHERGESTRLKIYFYVTAIWFHANPTLRDYRATTSTWTCCPCSKPLNPLQRLFRGPGKLLQWEACPYARKARCDRICGSSDLHYFTVSAPLRQ